MERNGEAYHPASVIDAQAKGVAMIVQEMGTASNITVTENIFIGKEDIFIKMDWSAKKLCATKRKRPSGLLE